VASEAEIAEALRILARRDPNRFAEYCFRDDDDHPIKQGDIHRQWHDAMSAHRHVMIESPREHGKTSQAVFRLIWELGNDNSLGATIVCANDDKAKKRLSEVTRHIERNERVHRVFPKLKVDAASTTKLLLKRKRIAREASVESYGVMSSGTGDRSDLVVFDDICDRRNSLTVPALRQQVKDAYRNDWMNLLGPRGRSWYLYTPWHREDLSHELVARRLPEVALVQHRVKVDWTVDGKPRYIEPVWPEHWSAKALVRRLGEIQRRAFLRGFCGQAVDDQERAIWPEWFRFGFPPFSLADAVRIQVWDGASPRKTTTKDPDYQACVDLYVSPLHSKIFVADAWRARGLPPSRQVRAVTSRTEVGPPPSYVVIEQTGQSALAASVAESGHDLRGARLVPIGAEGKSKELRAQEYLAPLMEAGSVIFSPNLDPDIEEDAPPLKTELIDLPFGDHDDLADCLVYGARVARKLVSFGIVGDLEPRVSAEVELY
jgi:phage terminase large subunit-like protein